MLGVGVSVTQLAVRGRLAIILGTGPVLAPLAVGDNINARVTWGSYTPTAPAVSINAPTVKEYRVNGALTWTTFGDYTVGQGDVVEIRETVTDNTGRQAFFTASRTAFIAAPVNTVLPTITGLPREGQTLTRSLGTWTGFGTITYATQWRRGATDIPGATGATYVPTADDVGFTISVRVTATNGGGPTPVTSDPTTAITSSNGPPPLFQLTLTGNTLNFSGLGLVLEGETLEFI